MENWVGDIALTSAWTQFCDLGIYFDVVLVIKQHANKTKHKQARGNSPACSWSVPTHHAHFKHLVKCCLKFRFFMGFVTQPCNLHAFYVWKNPGRVSHTPWRAKKLPVQDIQIKTEFFISFGSEFLLFLKKRKRKIAIAFSFLSSVFDV